jgi:hypothetical protein
VLLFLGLVLTVWSQEELDRDFIGEAKNVRSNQLSKSPYLEGYYTGYVAGAGDALSYIGAIQIPPGTRTGTVMEVVAKYVVDHPEEWRRGKHKLVIYALETAYPYPNPAPKPTKIVKPH